MWFCLECTYIDWFGFLRRRRHANASKQGHSVIRYTDSTSTPERVEALAATAKPAQHSLVWHAARGHSWIANQTAIQQRQSVKDEEAKVKQKLLN